MEMYENECYNTLGEMKTLRSVTPSKVATPQGEISSKLGRQEVHISDIRESVGILSEMLQPILETQAPIPEEDCSKESVNCEIGGKLSTHNERLRELNRWLREIIERLQL